MVEPSKGGVWWAAIKSLGASPLEEIHVVLMESEKLVVILKKKE
jgi:hypothetical protein